MIKFLKNIKVNIWYMFFISFFLYFLCGLVICFSNETLVFSVDKLFSIDSRYTNYVNIPSGFYSGFFEHPLKLIIVQPLIFLINSVVNSLRASVLILQALVASASICLVYFAVKNFTQKTPLSLLFALIYGFSLSTILFAIIPESYIFSGFFNLLLIYYVSLIYKKESLSFLNIFTLALLMAFPFGINAVNIINTTIFMVFMIFYINKKNIFKSIKQILLIFILFLVIVCSGVILEKFAYNFDIKNPSEGVSYNNTPVQLVNIYWFKNKVGKVSQQLFTASLYSIDFSYNKNFGVHVNDKPTGGLMFDDYQDPYNFIPIIILLHVSLTVLILRFRTMDKKFILFMFLSIILLNFFLYSVYAFGHESFLCSQNILPYYILLLAMIFCGVHSEIAYTIPLSAFILYQAYKNIMALYFITRHFEISLKTYIPLYFVYSAITTVLIISFLLLFKKFFQNTEISIHRLLLLLCVIIVIFGLNLTIFDRVI